MKIDYEYEEFYEKLLEANIRREIDLRLITNEILLRYIEADIIKLIKFNGAKVQDTNLPEIQNLEYKSGCPVVMVNMKTSEKFICLDHVRVRPKVLSDEYHMKYLFDKDTYISDVSKNIKNTRKNLPSMSNSSKFISLGRILKMKILDIYEELSIKFHTATDIKTIDSKKKNSRKLITIFKTYDAQTKRNNGNLFFGRGSSTFNNSIDGQDKWSDDKFRFDSREDDISYKTAKKYINSVEKLIEKVQNTN